MTPDATALTATVDRLAGETHGPQPPATGGPRRQRWIRLLDLRAELGWPTHRVDQTVRDLYRSHDVWLRWPDHSTLEEDQAAITISGQSYHHITTDPWH